MKIVLLSLFISGTCFAGNTYVQGYVRSNGTVVSGYNRTTPDNTINNNYGTQGNTNPYTNVAGQIQRNPYQSAGVYNLGNGE